MFHMKTYYLKKQNKYISVINILMLGSARHIIYHILYEIMPRILKMFRIRKEKQNTT